MCKKCPAKPAGQEANYSSTFLMIRAGFPAATQLAGMSFVTTEPAPMTTLSPMVTPGRMQAFPPIQTFSPMVMAALQQFPSKRRFGEMG